MESEAETTVPVPSGAKIETIIVNTVIHSCKFTGADVWCYDERIMVTNVVATITALEAQAAASLFLSDNLGDRFLASSPKRDVEAKLWRVPVLLAYPIIGPVGQTGEILVNETSEKIISYTPLDEM